MRMMHTKLPEFIAKMKRAVVKHFPDRSIEIKGLENLQYAKMQSLRTGRIEEAVEEVAAREDVCKVEMDVIARIPETMHTVLIKGIDKEGRTQKIILEVINILHPTEVALFDGCKDIEDRRPPVGLH